MSFFSRLFSGKSLRRLLLIVFFCLLAAAIWYLGPYLGFGDTRPLEAVEPRIVSLLMTLLLLLGCWFYLPMFALVAVVACTLVWVVGPWLLTGDIYPLQNVFNRLIIIAIIVTASLAWAGWKLLQALARNPAFLSSFVKKTEPEQAESTNYRELRNVIRDGVRYMERMYRTVAFWRRFFFIRPQEEGLPWFLMLGPKGAGKTSLIFASGQDFPLPEQLNRKGKENVPTRHCECLFTNDALFLDTSGKYLTEDKSAHEEWDSLIAALKKYRGYKAINGVVVTLSAADILTMEGNALLDLSSAIRARLDDLRDRLGLRFPVYVTVTHLDQLTGFTAYFRNLTEKDREQIWGVTLPYGPQPELSTSAALKKRITDELYLLESRILDAINTRQQEEYGVQERKQMYALPEDFRMLRHSVGEILHNIFFASRFDETCSYSVLRGIYFLSNCQPNNDILVNNSTLLQKWHNAVTHSIAKTPASLSQHAPDDDAFITGASWGRQFFHKVLFNDVIVQDNPLASSDMRRGSHVKVWHLLGHLAAIIFGIWLVSVISTSHKNNERYLAAVTAKVRQLATRVSEYSKQPEPENLPALLDATQGLAQYDGMDMDSPGIAWRYGLYTGGTMVKNADTLYHFYLERYLVPQIDYDIRDALRSAVIREDAHSLYPLLKLYLVFSGSGRFDASYLAEKVADRWEDNGKINAYGQRYIFVEHLKALFSGGQWHRYREPEDKKLIRQARDILSQQTQTNRIWQRMQEELTSDAPANITLRAMTGDRSSQIFTLNDDALLQDGIPGIYTREAWQQQVKKKMITLLPQLQDEDQWVMKGASSAFNPLKLHENIQTLYLQAYERNWRQFSEAVRLIPADDSNQFVREGMSFELALLHELVSDTSPLRNLLQAIVRETSLAESDKIALPDAGVTGSSSLLLNQAKQLKDNVELREIQQVRYYVDDRFSDLRMFVQGDKTNMRNRDDFMQQQGTALNHLLSNLRDQYTRIRVFNAVPDENDSPSLFSDSAKLAAQAPGWPLPVRNIIVPLLDRSYQKVRHNTVAKDIEKISQGPGEICRNTLEGNYPFADSERSVALNQFERFFSRDGIVDSWFRQNLAAKVDTSRRPWRFKASDSQEGLAFFEQAAAIRDAFFTDDLGKKMALTFSVSVPRLSPHITQLAFTVDGSTMHYSHGPISVEQYSWPGNRRGELISMTAQRQQGTTAMPDLIFRGPWAILRWLDSADDLRTGDNGRDTYSWHLGAGITSLEIEGLNYNGRPLIDLLRRFRCPEPSGEYAL